ncbi:MAG: YciI family protein [Cellvibrionaceae bacterium]
MSKLYMCILRNAKGGCDEPSPSQMDDAYAKFQQWHEQFADNIADMGGKLGEGKVLTANGVTDGPFIEVKEMIGGYMLLNAKNVDEAIHITRQCPPVAASLDSTSVEVREIMKP